MAGRLINVQGKQVFTFNNAASQVTTIYLGSRAYTITDCVSGVLLVRLAAQSLPTGATAVVNLVNVMIAADDPTSIYTPVSGGNFASVTINAADTVASPRLYTTGFTSASSPAPGAMFAATLVVTYAGTTGASAITLGVDAVIRDALAAKLRWEVTR